MVRVKKMNESLFAKLQKDLTIAGEIIRARQEEKQGLLDEFDQESKRYFFGKISQRALATSIKKTNKEVARLNKSIREAISRVKKVGDSAAKLTIAQAPIAFRATLTGISGGPKKKKKAVKKKVVKKKPAKKKVKKKKAPVKKKVAKKKKVVKKKVVKKKAVKRKVVKKKPAKKKATKKKKRR